MSTQANIKASLTPLELGKQLMEQGKLDEAIVCYRNALDKPNLILSEANHHLAVALTKKGRLDKAVIYYRKAIELDSNYLWSHHNLGEILAKQGQLDEAICSYRKAIKLKPNIFRAYLRLGEALAAKERFDEAFQCYCKAIELNPNCPQFHRELAVIQFHPDCHESCYKLGAFLEKLGQFEAANTCYQRAIQIQSVFEANFNNFKAIFSTEDTYSISWFYPRYADGKIHEEVVTKLILNALEGAKCFVDIGTNLGWYTCLASKYLLDGITYGFEMDELNFALLKRNVEINQCQNSKIYHAAVTDTPGSVKYIRKSMKPSPVLSLSLDIQETEPTDSGEVVSVEAIMLDDFFKNKEVMPDVVKIDVEGAEMKVLNGMKNIIESYAPKLFIEVHPKQMSLNFRSSVEELVSFLIARRYQVFEIKQMRKHGVNKKLRKLDKNSQVTSNTMLYACP